MRHIIKYDDNYYLVEKRPASRDDWYFYLNEDGLVMDTNAFKFPIKYNIITSDKTICVQYISSEGKVIQNGEIMFLLINATNGSEYEYAVLITKLS